MSTPTSTSSAPPAPTTDLDVAFVARPIDEQMFVPFGLPACTFAPLGAGVTVHFDAALTPLQVDIVYLVLSSLPSATLAGMQAAITSLGSDEAFLAAAAGGPLDLTALQAQVVSLTEQIITLARFTMGQPS